jgi:cytochrome P450
MEDLIGLPYLDAVVRETLRLHPPVAVLPKVAMKDDTIPLDKPFTDKHGSIQQALRYVSTDLGENGKPYYLSTIRISKGDSVFIPVRAMNKSKAIWGEDATEFK